MSPPSGSPSPLQPWSISRAPSKPACAGPPRRTSLGPFPSFRLFPQPQQGCSRGAAGAQGGAVPPPPPGNLTRASCPTKCVCKELAAREPPKPCAISGSGGERPHALWEGPSLRCTRSAWLGRGKARLGPGPVLGPWPRVGPAAPGISELHPPPQETGQSCLPRGPRSPGQPLRF